MTSPSLIDYFNDAYKTFSVPVTQLTIPPHFDTFLPDDPNDTGCRSIIMPSPLKGAKNFVKNNRFTLIGIYHDAGRPTTPYPVFSNLSWSRVGAKLTVNHVGHETKVGDVVFLYNMNITKEQRCTVSSITSTSFTVNLQALVGKKTGTQGGYRLDRNKNFYEENLIFRLLPNFNVVPFADILSIFADTDPNITQGQNFIRNLTTNSIVPTPSAKNSFVDYSAINNYKRIVDVSGSLPDVTVTPKYKLHEFEHEQVFDDQGNAVRLRYAENGQVINPGYYDKQRKNNPVMIASPRVNEVPDDFFQDTTDVKVWAYDYYGFLINDTTRGPFNSDQIITRDASKTTYLDNITIAQTVTGADMYPVTQQIYDIFGNVVIGIRPDNTLVVQKQRVPLELDNFGKPVKAALK
jgi:hypothetical protein